MPRRGITAPGRSSVEGCPVSMGVPDDSYKISRTAESLKSKTMAKVVLKGYIEVIDAELDLIRAELPIHTDLTLQESGCLEFRVEQDPYLKNRFTVYEVFDSEEAFERHQERVRKSRWGFISRNVQRHYCVALY